jgi:hypothetical protein
MTFLKERKSGGERERERETFYFRKRLLNTEHGLG